MKIYFVWEIKENRPAIARGDFGNACCFLSKENAQAKLKDLVSCMSYTISDNGKPIDMPYEVKEFDITI